MAVVTKAVGSAVVPMAVPTAEAAKVAEQTGKGSEVVLKAVAPEEAQTGLEMEAAAEAEAGEAARQEVELRAAAPMAAEKATLPVPTVAGTMEVR